MPAPDPTFLQDAAKYLWSLLLIPVGIVWKRMDGAVQKEDFERHKDAVRESIRDLYQNAEDDRKLVRDGFDQLSKEIHETHIALLSKMEERR